MGSFLRLAKALSKNNKLNTSANSIESDEDKAYQKYLESLNESELEDLIKEKLLESWASDEGRAYHLKISGMTEAELALELMEKLKVH